MFTTQNLTLLYIDGNAENREKNVTLIRQNGVRVFTANTTHRADDLYKSYKVDLIILELPLRDENGLDFIRHLRQMNITIPVILITSEPNQDLLLQAINLDISHCLIRPFEDADLLEALRSASKKLLNVHGTSFINLQDGFSYDVINKAVNRPDGSVINLSKKEYLLLELLIQNNRKIVPYETIESIVWRNTTMSVDTLRTLVRAIRKKTYPDIIMNNNSIGYKISI